MADISIQNLVLATVLKGGLIFTGNTLGYSGRYLSDTYYGAKNSYYPIIIGSSSCAYTTPVGSAYDNQNTIGAFLALTPSLSVFGSFIDASGRVYSTTSTDKSIQRNYPSGSTLDWKKNGSAAQVVIPEGADVRFAYLIWSGIYQGYEFSSYNVISGTTYWPLYSCSFKFGNVPTQGQLDVKTQPIKFILPGSKTISLTGSTINGIDRRYGLDYKKNIGTASEKVAYRYYMCGADVTKYVQEGQSGTYAVSQVPAILGREMSPQTRFPTTQDDSYVGWTLAVVYEDSTKPYQFIYLYDTFGIVAAGTSESFISLSNIYTPVNGDVRVRVLISAGEGDSNRPGEYAAFGYNQNNLTKLYGANNRIDDFFSAQINIADSNNIDVGRVDTRGTKGELNIVNNSNPNQIYSDPMPPIQAGYRYGYDITNVRADNILKNGVNDNVYLKLSSTLDGYYPNLLGLQIAAYEPQLNVTKSVDRNVVRMDDILIYTILIENMGNVSVSNISIVDQIPTELKEELINSSNYYRIQLFSNEVWSDISYTGTLSSGVSLTNQLNPNEKIKIMFKASINSVPQNYSLMNNATVNYKFKHYDEQLVAIDGSIKSNDVITYIYDCPNLKAVKNTLSEAVIVGKDVKYEIILTNESYYPVISVTVTDIFDHSISHAQYQLSDGVWRDWPNTNTLQISPLNLTYLSSYTIYVKGELTN